MASAVTRRLRNGGPLVSSDDLRRDPSVTVVLSSTTESSEYKSLPSFSVNPLVLAAHSPLLSDCLLDSQFQDDVTVILVDFCANYFLELDHFLHEGVVVLPPSKAETVRQLKSDIEALGCTNIPSTFWSNFHAFDGVSDTVLPMDITKTENTDPVPEEEFDVKKLVKVTIINDKKEPIRIPVRKKKEPVKRPVRKKKPPAKFMNKTFDCPLCHKDFVGASFLEQHIKRHENEGNEDKKWFCLCCDSTFSRYKYLKDHLKANHKEDTLTCQICNKTFSGQRQNEFQQHKKEHHVSTERVCETCGKKFESARQLSNHKMSTHKVEPSTCHICGIEAKNKVHLSMHIRRNHSVREPCEFCGKLMKNRDVYRRHILAVHTSEDQKPFKCDICKKGFGRKCSLNEHMLIHSNTKPFKCQACDFSCNSVANRNKHERQKHGLHQFATAAGRVTVKVLDSSEEALLLNESFPMLPQS